MSNDYNGFVVWGESPGCRLISTALKMTIIFTQLTIKRSSVANL